MKILTLVFAFFSLSILLSAQIPAFPGAEGGGMYTTGGRRGVVYFVNTLEDNNSGNTTTREGSLRWCIGQSSVRTIVFKVSGTIMLKSALKITNGNLTIAGQTAPGDGVCLGNYPVEIAASNVIVRYLRFRMGDDAVLSGGSDAFGGRFFKNVIIDHCSMSWSTDECVSFYNCDHFTLQWCLISESLRLSTHDKGAHGYGGIWGGTNTTFHHNLMAHHDSRTPRFGPGQNIAPHIETIDHRNNVNYNHGNTYGGEGMNINMVNNYFKPGPASNTGTARGRIISFDKDKNVGSIRYNVWGRLFVEGNVINDGKNDINCVRATSDNWVYGVFNQFHSSYGAVSAEDKASIKMQVPFKIYALSGSTKIESSVTTHTAEKAYEKVLNYAGASLRRDTYDARIINETRTGTTTFKGLNSANSGNYPKPGIIDSHRDIKPSNADANWTPWPILSQADFPADVNRDGIPDAWLETNYPGKFSNDLNEDGYTILEVYLNSLVGHITTDQYEGGITSLPAIGKDIKSDISVFVDRNTGVLNVKSESLLRAVSVYDASGIKKLFMKCNDRNLKINVLSFRSSVYFIKAENDKGLVSNIKILI